METLNLALNITNLILIIYCIIKIRSFEDKDSTESNKGFFSKVADSLLLEKWYDDEDDEDDDEDDLPITKEEAILRLKELEEPNTDKNNPAGNSNIATTLEDPPQKQPQPVKIKMIKLDTPDALIEYLKDRYYSQEKMTVYDILTNQVREVSTLHSDNEKLYIHFSNDTVARFQPGRFSGFSE